MREKLNKYLSEINRSKFSSSNHCNSLLLNILNIKHPNHKMSDEIESILNEWNYTANCYNFRDMIKKYGNARKYLKLYGYGLAKDQTKILPGDFLIKPRKYFDDVIYVIDAVNYVGLAPRHPWDKSTMQMIISNKFKLNKENQIWRIK